MFEILLLALLIGTMLKLRQTVERLNRLTQEFEQFKAATPPLLAESQTAPDVVAETAGARMPETFTESVDAPAAFAEMPQALEAGMLETAAAAPTESATKPAERARSAKNPRPAESLESLIGARWAVWAGGLTLALGGLFLVRYSIEQGLIGPMARLMLAAVFGLALIAAGEAIRRRLMPRLGDLADNAMVPGVLTAAGSAVLFGTVYGAHSIYGYIGPAAAFGLLGLIALVTLGLSLAYGQGLAGLGLLGAMVTPLLVAANAPAPWTLFAYLTVAMAATHAAARLRGWLVAPALAALGIGAWVILYLAFTPIAALTPPVLALIATIAAVVYVWPAAAFDRADEEAGSGLSVFARPPSLIAVALPLAVLPAALSLLAVGRSLDADPVFATAAVIAATAAIATTRRYLALCAIASGLAAIAAAFAIGAQPLSERLIGLIEADMLISIRAISPSDVAILLGLGAIFAMLAVLAIARRGHSDPAFARLWTAIGAVAPLSIALVIHLAAAGADALPNTLYAAALALFFGGAAEWLYRRDAGPALARAIDILAAACFAALALAIEAASAGLWTVMLLPLAALPFVVAARFRPWPVLAWTMIAALIGVLVHIAFEPTLVGRDALSKAAFLNPLLPGYGLPAALAIIAARLTRDLPAKRVHRGLQALGAVLSFLAVTVLLRHAMNGGVLSGPITGLGEQAIYTLVSIGFSAVMMALDGRTPSPVLRLGAMIAAGLSMAQALVMHLGALNPFFTGETLGGVPGFDLLLIGYLLPAIAYGAVAFHARGRRPLPYVAALAVSSAALGFVWATLSVRRLWQGQSIASWKGFLAGETYSYSVAWLAIGVGLLVVGSRLDVRGLRIASAVLVVISVAKAFLIDMSSLEGVLRALSFIGLGVVLIGIGLFYQRILTRRPAPSDGDGDGP